MAQSQSNPCSRHMLIQCEKCEDLRDQFAMAALTGILASGADRYSQISPSCPLSMRCYEIADAMLEARKPK